MKKNNRYRQRFSPVLSVALTLLLAACGGGGGGSDPADTTPPMVVSTYPADTTVDVVTGTPVRVTFSEPMDSATLDTTSFTLATTSGGVPVSGTVSYDTASYTATFTPDTALGNAVQYTATVNTGATDTAGNALAAAHTWDFTTAAVTAVWESVGGQVSPAGTESEDPTMLITGATPSVGYRHGSYEINLNTWNGIDSWGVSKAHSGSTNSSIYGTPGFATDGANIFVAYSLPGVSGDGEAAFHDRIYLDQCTTGSGWTTWNGGSEISVPWNASDLGANAFEPAVAVAGGMAYVGWTEADVAPEPDTEAGAWVASVNVSSSVRSGILSRDDRSASYYTDVRTVGITADDAGNVYLAQWESDAVDQDLTNLYVTKYAGGAFTNLGGVVSADYDYNNLSVPSLEVIGSDLYIAYTEANSTDYTQHVYVKKYSDGSWTTVGGGPVSAFSAAEHYDSDSPDLAVVDGNLYLAWSESDQYNGTFIFVARYDSANSQWVIDGDKLNVDPARAALDPSLAYSAGDSTLYVAFEEYVDGYSEIFVKRKVLTP